MKLRLALLLSLPWAVVSTPALALSPHPARNLIVVSPESFEEPLREFVAWKKTCLPTTWISLEEITRSSPGVDDPEKLKHFLHEKWRGENLGYVLLVGDADVMPVRYMVLDRKTEEAFNHAFYPSDLYFADLAKPDRSFEDWNANKDAYHAGYFGEVRGEHFKNDPINFDAVDYSPEVAVGRWPVSTAEEVKHIAEKSMMYETKVLADTDPSLRRAGFVVVDGWVDTRPQLGDLAKRLYDPWRIEKRFYGTDSPPPDTKEVLGLLNEGTGLMVHTGHGTPERWEQCLSIADIDKLTATASPAVFISAGCSTAHFAPLPPYEPYLDQAGNSHAGTYQKEQFTEPPLPPSPIQSGAVNPTCLGERLLKKAGTGGVAYIGCNTGSQPFGLTLVDGFITKLADSDSPRLGDCWNAAVDHYISHEKLADLKPTDSWVPPSIFFQAMKFMVFGDPSLRLPGRSISLPTAVDLRPQLEAVGITPRQQGERGTCSVFTVTTALEYALAGNTKSTGRLSVEYLNWASNQAVGHFADGGFFSDLWEGFQASGICEENQMPYSTTFDADRKPDAVVIASAKTKAGHLKMSWIKPWDVKTGLTTSQLTSIKQTLAKGQPICTGLRWPKKPVWKNEVLQMCLPDAVFDGHSVLITGYQQDPAQPGGGTFSFYNSNRPDKLCRMPWEYALTYMNDAMWIAPAD